MHLVTLMFCVVHVVYSADYITSDDLFPNEFITTQLHYGPDFSDTTLAGGDGQNIDLKANFSLFGKPFDGLTVCDFGTIYIDNIPGICGGPFQHDVGIIAPHFRAFTEVGGNYRYSINHIKRNEEVSGMPDNEIYVGAAVNDLKRIAGEIDDCNQNTRTTTKIVETVIVTWKLDDGAGNETLPQAVLALTSDGETFVLMLFKDNSGNDFSIFNERGAINNGASEFGNICSANDGTGSDLSMTSNCQCAQSAGIYIFNTTSAANGCNFFGPNSCDVYEGLVDDTANHNPNCREPVVPQDTCKEEMTNNTIVEINVYFGEKLILDTSNTSSYYCQVNKTSASEFELNIVVHDINLSNYTFVQHSEIPEIKDFDDPGKCSGSINNNDKDTITITDSFSSASCVQQQAKDSIAFALWFYDDTENTITQDGSRIIQGICDASDLVDSVTDTIKFSPVYSTVVPKRTFATEIGFTDRRGGLNAQIYSTQDIYPGTIVYLYTCFKRDNDFNPNADAFGHYTHSCTFSGDPKFTNPNQMHSQSIDSLGCPSSSRNGLSGYFQREFEYDKDFTDDQSEYDWCQVSGAINAFKWRNTDRLYVRCYIDFCKNYDDMENSQCWDSCRVPKVIGRKKREIGDERITLTASINIGSNYTSSSSGQKCVDATTAIATLSGLLSALVIATTVSIVLFVKVYQKKNS